VFDLGDRLEAFFGPSVPHADILHPWFLLGRVVCTLRPELTPKLIVTVATQYQRVSRQTFQRRSILDRTTGRSRKPV
jgi:hypothetical protein